MKKKRINEDKKITREREREKEGEKERGQQ
jgi:hypothetical protein